jgi:SAM-dependent methyltransferase
MHKQTKNLQNFYDATAESFSGTRQRVWPEFAHIAAEIVAYAEKKAGGKDIQTLRVLELGCGDGRLLGYLQAHTLYTYDYTGVDISYNLLAIADQHYPHARRVHEDMIRFSVAQAEKTPESYDIIIAVASFHHLPTVATRRYTLAGLYQSLVYDGKIIMTNRCYSDWFKKKFRREIGRARVLSLLTLGYKSKDDIMVPRLRNDRSLVAHRLYHVFGQLELTRLMQQEGFAGVSHTYVRTD